jgi:hypothetical protein
MDGHFQLLLSILSSSNWKRVEGGGGGYDMQC